MKTESTVRLTLANLVGAIAPITPKASNDSDILEGNRVVLGTQITWLAAHKNNWMLEKVFDKVLNVLVSSNQSEVIAQACIIKNLGVFDEDMSKKISAQIIYLLSRTGILRMFKSESEDGRKYFKVGLGDKFDNIDLDSKKKIRRIKNKIKRLVLDEASTSVRRNNNNGFYDFDPAEVPNGIAAAKKMQGIKLKLEIPETITEEEVAEYVYKFNPLNPDQEKLYYEVLGELRIHNRNSNGFYVTKTLDRVVRIYGHRWLDLTSSSHFRVMLRLSRKRRVTKDGYEAYQDQKAEYIDTLNSIAHDNGIPEYEKYVLMCIYEDIIQELSNLKVGSYTAIMIEVDANNQGPAIVAGFMQDSYWFKKYWGDIDAPKMYTVFRENLLTELDLPLDLFVDKDVKYKIMTKPYNKADKSNVFGDAKFRGKLENDFLPGMILNSTEFYALPLKYQLQRKLGEQYKFEDKELLSAYKTAVKHTAPFLEQYQQIINLFQINATVKPSIWSFPAVDGDIINIARSINATDKIEFIDIIGSSHSFTYEYKTLVEPGKKGGETALSPGHVAGFDSGIAKAMIIEFEYDLFSNHDGFFGHGNDKKAIIKLYTKLYSKSVTYGNEWLRYMINKYGCKKLDFANSFVDITGNTDILTEETILSSTNLIG